MYVCMVARSPAATKAKVIIDVVVEIKDRCVRTDLT